jgi:hypothetical protein
VNATISIAISPEASPHDLTSVGLPNNATAKKRQIQKFGFVSDIKGK